MRKYIITYRNDGDECDPGCQETVIAYDDEWLMTELIPERYYAEGYEVLEIDRLDEKEKKHASL